MEKEKVSYRKILRDMKSGEIREYPREEYGKIKSATTTLWTKGYNFIVSSKKEDNVVIVKRLADD